MATVLEKTWNTADLSRVVQDSSTAALLGKSVAWHYVSFLLGVIGGMTGAGLWTTDFSCNGSTAGSAGDGVNRWGTTFTSANLVNSSSAHSWYVLKHTNGFSICIDLVNSTASLINIAMCKGSFTGGSASARPTNANEVVRSTVQICQNSAAASKVHGSIASDGSFYILTSKDTGGAFQSILSFFSLATGSLRTSDAHNGWLWADGGNTPVMGNSGTGAGSPINSNSVILGRSGANAASVTGGFTMAAINNVSGAGAGMLQSGNMSSNDAEEPGTVYDDDVSYLYVSTASHLSKRGRIQDFRWAPNTLVTGQLEPSSGPPYARMVVGNMWFPVNGVTTGPAL